MNTFWLVVAGLIFVIAAILLFVWLPRLNKPESKPSGALSILAGGKGQLVVGTIAVLLLAGSLYMATSGSGSSVSTDLSGGAPMSPEHVAMIKGLADRLEKNPDDGNGWAMLARSYATLGRYKDALPAYEKAAKLIPNDPILLVDYADVMAAVNGKNLQGKPLELLQEALRIDPNNVKGLNLIGSAAYQTGDYGLAITYWEKLLKILPPDSPNARKITSYIDNARARKAGTASGAQPAENGARISGVVKVSPALVSKVSPSDIIFVFAKAISGPPMPIAVIRGEAKDLPRRFILSDKMAMMPSMKLSNFKEVSVSARISKSGKATSQSGDLQGEVSPVKVGTTDVQLIIDKVVQ